MPNGGWPLQLAELNLAVNYLLHHADEYPIDSSSLFLSGDSAGANITSTYAAAVRSPVLRKQLAMDITMRPGQLRGLVVHSGVYDMKKLYHNLDKQNIFIKRIVYDILNSYSNGRASDDYVLDGMSAYPWVNSQFPPVFISASANDLLTEGQTMPFIQKLKEKHVPVDVNVFPKEYGENINHDLNFNMDYEASRQVFASSLSFMKNYANLKHESTH